MTSHVRLQRLLLAALTAVLAALPLAQAAHAGPQPADVPTRIKVEDGNKVFLVRHAIGVQIYSCNATASGYAWTFVAPRANLYDENGKLDITHFAGPTWQANDGSQVVGQRVDGVTVDQTAIPWLLLSAASKRLGPGGGDRLAATSFIQRVATHGGLPPGAASCNADVAGAIAEVPYSADYYFWKRTAS